MSDPENSAQQPSTNPREQKPNNELRLALIQHGSRPAAIVFVAVLVVIWLFPMRERFFSLLGHAEELKLGSFSLRLREQATSANLGEEYKKLETLSLEQIQLFLIVGAKRKADISYRGPEVSKENLEKLQEVGLLQDVKVQEDGNLSWRPTEEGTRLHKIIIEQVVASIRSG